jgi:hypothetical protein
MVAIPPTAELVDTDDMVMQRASLYLGVKKMGQRCINAELNGFSPLRPHTHAPSPPWTCALDSKCPLRRSNRNVPPWSLVTLPDADITKGL